MKINGTFDSERASLLEMQLVRCRNSTDYAEDVVCKSNEEITEFFRNKYLILLHNQKRFNPELYHESSIIRESKIVWAPINIQWRQEIPYRIQKTQIFLQDEFVDLDDLTLIEDDSIFKVIKMPNKPYENDMNVQISVTVEMSLEQSVVARTGYTFLDVLSDVGGIQSILMTSFSIWMGAWNYKNFDNYMASKLFKELRKTDKT